MLTDAHNYLSIKRLSQGKIATSNGIKELVVGNIHCIVRIVKNHIINVGQGVTSGDKTWANISAH